MPQEVHTGLGEPTKPPALFMSFTGEQDCRRAGPGSPHPGMPWGQEDPNHNTAPLHPKVFHEMLMGAPLGKERDSMIKQVWAQLGYIFSTFPIN